MAEHILSSIHTRMKKKQTREEAHELSPLSPTDSVDTETENRRYYLTGLLSTTGPEEISEELNRYGEVGYVELDDLVDNENSAFVTFRKHTSALDNLVNTLKHLTIDSSRVSIVPATPKKTQIFVGGLKPDITAEILAHFFSKYGPVFDAMVKYDPNTGISRCFGFVTFIDSDDIVQQLCKERFFPMFGKRIEVKQAVPMSQQVRVKKAQIAAAYHNEIGKPQYHQESMRQPQEPRGVYVGPHYRRRVPSLPTRMYEDPHYQSPYSQHANMYYHY